MERRYKLGEANMALGERNPRAYEVAKGHLERLLEDNPRVLSYQLALARAHAETGVRLRVAKDFDGARTAYDASVSILKKLVSAHPEVADYRRALAATYATIGFHVEIPVGGTPQTV